MGPWIAMLMQSAMQNKQASAEEAAARKQAVASSYARSAAKNGFPMDGYEADLFNKQFRDQAEAAKSQWLTSMLSGLAGANKEKPKAYGFGNADSPESQQLSGLAQAKARSESESDYYNMGRQRGLW